MEGFLLVALGFVLGYIVAANQRRSADSPWNIEQQPSPFSDDLLRQMLPTDYPQVWKNSQVRRPTYYVYPSDASYNDSFQPSVVERSKEE
jgi:hypothetical protein